MSAQKGIGRLIQIGMVKESVRGTAVTTGGYYIPFAEAAFESKIENALDDQVYGVIEEGVSMTRVKNWMEGDIKAYVRDTHFGLMLKALFGSETSTSQGGGNAAVFDHKFTISESAQHPSVTLLKHDPLGFQDYTYANGMITKLELNYELKKFINYTASVVSQAGVKLPGSSVLTPVNTTENYFVPQYLTFKSAATTGALAAASAIQLKAAKLTLDQSVEHQEVLGNASPADFLNKQFKVEGTIEAIWQNETDFFANYIANTAQALQLDCKNTDVTLGASSNPELKVVLDQVYFTELTKPIKINDLIYQTIKFKAVYNLTNAEMVAITLSNLVSAVY